MNDLGNEQNCILCDQGVKEGDQLNDVGSRWTLVKTIKRKSTPWIPLLTKQRKCIWKIF